MTTFTTRTLRGAILALLCASCSSLGPKKLVSSHTAYNDAVQLTVTREVLSNIVRTRYADPMQFLAVQSINAQFSVNAGGSASVGGLGQAGAVGGAGGSVGYSDSPTISYTPQSDAGFYKSFYGLMDIENVIGFAAAGRFAKGHAGGRGLTVRLSFSALNGATDVILGEPNELYDRRLNALVTILESGATYRQVPEWDFDTSATPAEKVTSEDKVKAFQQSLYFVEEDGGKSLRLARYRMVIAIRLAAPDDPKVRAALEVPGVSPGRKQYILRPPTHATPGSFDPESIWVTPRSMADVLFVAAHFVSLPEAHAGVAPLIESVKDWPVRIRHSKEEPAFPYRVQHRGYWFYVDDADLSSRAFLEVLVAAYSSRVGSRQASDAGPTLVLPVG